MTDPKKKRYRKFRRADAEGQRLLVTTRQEFSLGLPTGGSLVCRLEKGAGRVISFYVGYYEDIYGVWTEIVSIDATKEEVPHLHKNWQNFKTEFGSRDAPYAKTFHEAIHALQESHLSHLESYLLSL